MVTETGAVVSSLRGSLEDHNKPNRQRCEPCTYACTRLPSALKLSRYQEQSTFVCALLRWPNPPTAPLPHAHTHTPL